MSKNDVFEAREFLQSLVNQPLRYGLKSPDTELYEFGFGNAPKIETSQDSKQIPCTYTLHIICCFRLIRKDGSKRVDLFCADTPVMEFDVNIKRLIGRSVKRVALSEKNDLWLDFGDYWVVLITFEDGEESWRFFATHSDDPHLVASNVRLDLQDETGEAGVAPCLDG